MVKFCYRYAVTGNEEEWEKAVSGTTASIVSVKKKRLGADAADDGIAKKKKTRKEKKHKH